MFKRRVAVVGVAAVLGLVGMAGSALADDGIYNQPKRHTVRVAEPVGAGRLVCWASDGKAIRFTKAKVAELIDENVIGHGLAEVVTGGKTIETDSFSINVPAGELPRKVFKHRFRGRVLHLTCTVEGPDDGPYDGPYEGPVDVLR
jgi:hypothetical protein